MMKCLLSAKVAILILYSGIFLFFGCQSEPRKVSAGFYHWKSLYGPGNFAADYLHKIKCDKIYLHLFDVDWSEEDHFPEPVAIVKMADTCMFSVTPVVFITNQTFQRLPDSQIDSLAHLILLKMNALLRPSIRPLLISRFSGEVQFDCDWTAQTRNKYFSFLAAFKRYSLDTVGTRLQTSFCISTLSATIRLHQIKYFEKTGVPPVDRGVLMCYNTGDVDDLKTENSILQSGAIRDYLKNLSAYPLPLDVALPLFSWGVLFRNGEAIKLIDELQASEMDSLPEQFVKRSANRYERLKNGYFGGRYLYKNDEIRLEKIDVPLLKRTASELSARLPRNGKALTIIFYHLSNSIVHNYPYEKLENILSRFR